MKNRVVLIMKEDIVYYPPMLSIINVLLELQYQVIHIGVYSDVLQKKGLEKNGVIFLSTILYNGKQNNIQKFLQQITLRRQIKDYLKQLQLSKNDYVWIMQAETICLLHSLVDKYRTILQCFEYVEPKLNWKYRLFAPTFSMGKTMKKAFKVVCCEYNRAQITKGVFQLERLPNVLPNKPYLDNEKFENIPDDIEVIVENVKDKVKGKRIILYQGVFLSKERRLEEFCQAVQSMPDEYVFIAMGKSTPMYEDLKSKYASDRIIFIPFIRPPYHLLITQLASIGVLSYFPNPTKMSSVLNPLYCAPNKIFEYAKYGIPMISNDIPGLHYIYMEYRCGVSIQYPMTIQNIQDAIIKAFDNYEMYSKGALLYYNSVDMKKLIKNILAIAVN